VSASPRFIPLGQSGSKNGFGPIFGPDDIPVPTIPEDGPIDLLLSHFRFSDRLAPGVDIELDENGNLLAVDGSKWLNQQVAKLIQSSQDPNGPHPSYGTVLSAAIGQKKVGIFTKDIIAANVRSAIKTHQLALTAQPGLSNDQIVEDVVDVLVEDLVPGDKRQQLIMVLLRTRSGQITPVGNVVSV
jgi:hypothetical protein